MAIHPCRMLHQGQTLDWAVLRQAQLVLQLVWLWVTVLLDYSVSCEIAVWRCH
uniref:Uncharacterized protein n=1 Tax=Rhizophora mucronata TaxID=61149 RepID=A0A2P2QKP2_RHIMU